MWFGQFPNSLLLFEFANPIFEGMAKGKMLATHQLLIDIMVKRKIYAKAPVPAPA